MKNVIIIFLIFLVSCKTVDERIKNHSYTSVIYYDKGEHFQVYQTKKGSYYILQLNKKETKFKRKYLKIK